MKRIISYLLILIMLSVIVIGASIAKNELESIKTSSNLEDKDKKNYNFMEIDKNYLKENSISNFDTRLPIMMLDTHNQRLTKENTTWIDIALIEKDKSKSFHNFFDKPTLVSPATANLRGASSYTLFDKKQYRIKFYKEQMTNKEKEIDLFGMNKNSEWVLNGPFLDKTLVRNKLVYDISKELFEWSPDAKYLELFVDGKYQGIYLAIESIDRSESRLNLNKFGLLSGQTAYILKRERLNSDNNPIDTYGKLQGYTSNQLYIEYPTKNRLTTVQKNWIEKDISRFEKVLYSKDFLDKDEGYHKYIDMDNFVDYFILNEVVMNYDASLLSTYIYKDINDVLKLTVWDYNNCYDNFMDKEITFDTFILKNGIWFDRLLKDRAFVDKVVKRYYELRQSNFTKENFLKMITSYNSELGASVDRNFKIWGYSFNLNMLIGGNRDITSYEQANVQLYNAIDKRFKFLDENIEDLYQNCIN